MKHILLFEELNFDTLVSAANKARKIGHYNRAIKIEYEIAQKKYGNLGMFKFEIGNPEENREYFLYDLDVKFNQGKDCFLIHPIFINKNAKEDKSSFSDELTKYNFMTFIPFKIIIQIGEQTTDALDALPYAIKPVNYWGELNQVFFSDRISARKFKQFLISDVVKNIISDLLFDEGSDVADVHHTMDNIKSIPLHDLYKD